MNYDGAPSVPPEVETLLAANRDEARTRGPAMKGRISWEKLPATEREVETIAALWPGPSQPTLLRGSAAGETALRRRLASSRFVHLATHGFFADEQFRSMFGHDVQGEQLFGTPEMITARRAQVTAATR